VKKEQTPLTIEKIKAAHLERREEIKKRLAEFQDIRTSGTDERLWEEMVFCFFTGGCSARMGIRSVEATRPLLLAGNQAELSDALRGRHRYPNARAGYIVASREFLQEHCGLRLREKLESFDDGAARRDWLVKEKHIKGLGYKKRAIICETSATEATRFSTNTFCVRSRNSKLSATRSRRTPERNIWRPKKN
jgi:N-glycosylase/DNA lyase